MRPAEPQARWQSQRAAWVLAAGSLHFAIRLRTTWVVVWPQDTDAVWSDGYGLGTHIEIRAELALPQAAKLRQTSHFNAARIRWALASWTAEHYFTY